MTAELDPDHARIAEAILELTAARGRASSISPSDVAQALIDPTGAEADWQRLLPRVRRVAATLASAGQIEILRKGRPIAPEELRGVIRLRIAATEIV